MGSGWDWPAMAGAVAAVTILLGIVIYAWEIADWIRRWRER